VKHIRKRITYANVMSSIAVFLVLGGATAYAAKKIGSNEIKGNAITTGKLKKEAVTASKLKKSSVTTAKIANGAVTGEKVADGSLTSADISAATLTPTCGSGTVLAEGACFEVNPRAAATYDVSNETCVAVGRRLPSAAELSGFTRKVQTIPAQERSGDLFSTETNFGVNPNGTFALQPFATAEPFRCVGASTP
jgi:hypothetical protein